MLSLFQNLSFRVLLGILIGALLGFWAPELASQLKFLSDIFINMIKMCIGPIVFLTIVQGIGTSQNMKQFGRVGGKALLYFEVVTTLVLLIGWATITIFEPGAGFKAQADASLTSDYVQKAASWSWLDFLTHLVPSNIVKAFAEGDIMQILFISVFFGMALLHLGSTGQRVLKTCHNLQVVFFKILHYLMYFAPLGALGGIAFTIGKHGTSALVPLTMLMLCVYGTMFLFIFGVLNAIMAFYGFSLWRFLKLIRQELLIVLGTSSSETALPRIMDKLCRMGCERSVVGLVIPTGYSFNLDGTSIYLSMAVIFLAQVYGVELSWAQQVQILLVLMLTSKGAAAVTGGGFVVLASTLTAFEMIPVSGLALLVGVDRFMSEARAITNLIGNGVATLVLSKHEKMFEPQANFNVQRVTKLD
ncbi:MAG: C4-dicarboxylate transporter DctA [Cytophagales bacterium]|nr:MAG: C4-dicarboxylate transporter DctA [Cytophagales bacterium]